MDPYGMSRERTNSGSIDLDDATIINGSDKFATIHHVSESGELSGSLVETDDLDHSTVSEISLAEVFKQFSPTQPKTYPELASEYNKVKVALEPLKRTLYAKKVLLIYEIDELKSENVSLQQENEELKGENELLKSANESLQQKNVILQQENTRLAEDSIKKAEMVAEHLNKTLSKGGTLKRRTKRKVLRHKNLNNFSK
jgi:FtsZ-binding cell division protein ZapB